MLSITGQTLLGSRLLVATGKFLGMDGRVQNQPTKGSIFDPLPDPE